MDYVSSNYLVDFEKLGFLLVVPHQGTEDRQIRKIYIIFFNFSDYQACDDQVATTSTDRAPCRTRHTDSIQNVSHSSKYQSAGAESTQPSATGNQVHNDADATETSKRRI